jgi:hypothetical protein
MKTIIFFGVTILFAICATKIGICQSIDGQQTPPISTHKIIDDISPFIDEDTAIVCYVNLLAVKDCYKLADITERLAKVESFHERVRYYFALMNQRMDKKFYTQLAESIVPLLECGITYTYIVLNMRDLKFGAYFVFPDVQENSYKAKCIEKFFDIKNDTKNDGKQEIWFAHKDDGKSQTLTVYKENSMIAVGAKSISILSIIYFTDRELALMILNPHMMNAICGYYNLPPVDRKNYIRKRFETFKPVINKKFQQGIEEVNDCDFVKSVFLFPDSVVAWEFMHLKKMNEPLNQITFDFLKTTREYVAFGIDTNQPKIKLTVQCKTPEYAIKFKKFIDDVCCNIVNNYCMYLSLNPTPNNNKAIDDQKPMSPSDWAEFIVSILPKPKASKLITVMDPSYKK